jgi:hypothetical protein
MGTTFASSDTAPLNSVVYAAPAGRTFIRFAARCHQPARYPMGVLAGFTLLLQTLIGRPVVYKYVCLAVCLWEQGFPDRRNKIVCLKE